jgi:hypothetical protein
VTYYGTVFGGMTPTALRHAPSEAA